MHSISDSKVRGANMGTIWAQQDPSGPHIGPPNFAIWDVMLSSEFPTKPHYNCKWPDTDIGIASI